MRNLKHLASRLSPATWQKYQRRIWTVVKNSLHSLTLPFFGILVSYLVVKLASVERWGEFVQVMIFVQLGAHVMNWGNKEYLLREFSRNPSQMAFAWQRALWTRSLLLIPFGFILWLGGFSAVLTLFMWLWAVALLFFQSFDVWVVYRRDFLFAMLLEAVGILVMAAAIYSWAETSTVLRLTTLFALVYLGKTAALVARFRADVRGKLGENGRFQPRYFSLALPFFLLGLTGMLQSRIDLYTVSYYLPEKEVGQYQVFINLMIYAQSISAFILVPFIKTIYRLNNQAILKMSSRLFLLGCVLVIPLLGLAHVVITYLYGFELPLPMLISGGLFVIPIYFYLPTIYALYKTNVQWQVIVVNLVGLGMNFLLNLWLVPRVGSLGAMIGSAAAQWAMWLVYLWLSRGIRDEVIHEAAVPELP